MLSVSVYCRNDDDEILQLPAPIRDIFVRRRRHLAMDLNMGGLDAKDSMFYLVDMAVAARTVYCFMRTYFSMRLDRQAHAEKMGTQVNKSLAVKKKPVRVYMDGCFDAMHFGHANALRQAKALGDVLVVGINPAREICKHKGPPIMTDEERRDAVESIKWVDEVLVNVPYVVTPDFLNELITKHGIDLIAHGDDPCIGADGEDVYKAVKKMGRFRTVKRTEGVSSTDIVGRMLLCTCDHHLDVRTSVAPGGSDIVPFSRESSFLPTTRRLVQFAGVPRAPRARDRVVYCDGTFDMFHAGHIAALRRAKRMGDFLLVGIHDDSTVNERKGGNFPIMNLHERTLSVLACKFVDEVIIGAPWVVSDDMLKTMNISVVVHGTHYGDTRDKYVKIDRYAVPKAAGIFTEIPSTSDLSVHVILDRVIANREAFIRRNVKKMAAETEYLTKHKQYIQEC